MESKLSITKPATLCPVARKLTTFVRQKREQWIEFRGGGSDEFVR